MMVLYSGTTCPFSHRCRFVLFEKGMDFEIRDVDLYNKPEDINVMNPYGQVPILVERDLILYESNIINEYIDVRFPHPQLMPGDPVDRARVRLFLLNFEKELFVHVSTLESRTAKANEKALEKARSHIRDRLTQLAPVFLKNKYMLGDNFSMLDVAMPPCCGVWITSASTCPRTQPLCSNTPSASFPVPPTLRRSRPLKRSCANKSGWGNHAQRC